MSQKLLVQLTEADLRRLLREEVSAALKQDDGGGGYLSSRQLGKLLGVRPDTIRKWARREGLPHVSAGRFLRFDLTSVQAWLRQRAEAPGTWTGQHADRLAKIRGDEWE